MVIESGDFVQTKVVRPYLDFEPATPRTWSLAHFTCRPLLRYDLVASYASVRCGLELRSWCTPFTIRYSVHSADASGRRPVSSPLPRTVSAAISKLSALTQHHCPSVCPHRRIPTSDSNVSFFPYRMFSLFL